MTKGKTTHGQPRGENGRFIEGTVRMLRHLQDLSLKLQDDRSTHGNQWDALQQLRSDGIHALVKKNLPDVEAASIARVKRLMPSVMTPPRMQAVLAARTAKAPFWTWLFGNPEAYRTEEKRKMLIALQISFASAIKDTSPKTGWLKDLADIDAKMSVEDALLRQINDRLKDINRQIASLNKVYDEYSRPNAPAPDPKLAEAIASGNAKMRANPSIANSPVYHDDDSFWRDILIYDALTSRRDVHHYHEDTFRPGGGRSGGGGASSDYPAESPRRGDASVRMDDAAPAEEGNAGMRMSEAADSEEGNASVRMSDAPVIATPFESPSSREETTVSMGGGTHDDSPVSSSGTNY